MRLTIEKLVYGGAGLARTEAGVVFIPRTAPGDIVEAEIVQRKKDYSTARLTGIVEASPDRQEPYCPNYPSAGCCHWQHIRYDRQVDYKETIIRESLQRLGRIRWEGSIKRITGPERNYRLRATFHVVNGRPGFMQEKTNTVVPIRECASLVPELNQFIASLDPGNAVEVHAVSAPQIAATFVLPDGTILRQGNTTIRIEELQYRISAETFFQANRFLLASFINEVVQQAGPSPTHLLDLYAGSGFFSIPLAGIATEVIAVESSRTAIRQGRESARLNGGPQPEFFEGPVDAALEGADLKPDVVVLNPPRTGCGVKNAERIVSLGPRRIVYISCNPSTFAREAAVLISKSYELRQITLIDQFPNTYHIEMAALFCKPGS